MVARSHDCNRPAVLSQSKLDMTRQIIEDGFQSFLENFPGAGSTLRPPACRNEGAIAAMCGSSADKRCFLPCPPYLFPMWICLGVHMVP
jgi:hypothetical protein